MSARARVETSTRVRVETATRRGFDAGSRRGFDACSSRDVVSYSCGMLCFLRRLSASVVEEASSSVFRYINS